MLRAIKILLAGQQIVFAAEIPATRRQIMRHGTVMAQKLSDGWRQHNGAHLPMEARFSPCSEEQIALYEGLPITYFDEKGEIVSASEEEQPKIEKEPIWQPKQHLGMR